MPHDVWANLVCGALGSVALLSDILALYRRHEANLTATPGGAIARFRQSLELNDEVASYEKRANVATVQTFAQGQLFNITAGTLTGRFVSVRQPVYTFYVNNGGATAFLGFPTADELTLPNGNRRQNFEGGSIEYAPGSDPTLRLPVNTISLNGAGSHMIRGRILCRSV